jgi:hypothetical protein
MLAKLLSACLLSSPAFSREPPDLCSLFEKLPVSDRRHETFYLTFELMQQRQSKILVETGTARYGLSSCEGDGCSTLFFAEWARIHDAKVFSVDVDAQAIVTAEQIVKFINPNVSFYPMDSIVFFEKFDRSIDFLYLDSLDFDHNDPSESQLHHLKEIKAAYPHLHENSIILIDDCDLPHGGKGKLAIEWLKENGWKVILAKYQTVLVFEKQFTMENNAH